MSNRHRRTTSVVKATIYCIMVALCLSYTLPAAAQTTAFDPNIAWPLCGRVAAPHDQYGSWTDGDVCDSGRVGPNYADFPLAAPYGPRTLASTNLVYDWHRGIDMPAKVGTPVFAATDGVVRNVTGSGRNRRIVLRHCRPGRETDCFGTTIPSHGDSGVTMNCNGDACYYTIYKHLSATLTPAVNTFIDKGTHIGKTGCNNTNKCKNEPRCADNTLCSAPGVACSDGSTCTESSNSGSFPHLHFEVRNQAAATHDVNYSADAIHPLSVLPYTHLGYSNMSVDNLTAALNTDGTGTFTVESEVVLSSTSHPLQKVDLSEVSLRVAKFDQYQCYSGIAGWLCIPTYEEIAQPGNTPNSDGYLEFPSRINFVEFNHMFSHRRSTSSSIPSRLDYNTNTDHTNCPFSTDDHDLGTSSNSWRNTYYDWHLTKQASSSISIGEFNGITVHPYDHFSTNSTDYKLRVGFTKVNTDGEDGTNRQVCFTMRAIDLSGTERMASHCIGDLPPNPAPKYPKTSKK